MSGGPKPTPPPPPAATLLTRLAALQAIKEHSEKPKDKPKQAELAEARAKAVEIAGRERFFRLRDHWSLVIIVWISALILFNIVLTVLVGAGVLQYPELEWFITAVLVETFLQIVGLGYIAVRYLFSDKPPSQADATAPAPAPAASSPASEPGA